MIIETGTYCRITPAQDEYDNIKCKIKEFLTNGDYKIIYLEDVIGCDGKVVLKPTGATGIFSEEALIPEAPLMQLARAMNEAK